MVAIDRILCPVDFSDVSRHALQQAAVVARWYKAQLTALHVLTPVVLPPVMMQSPDLLRAVLPTAEQLQKLEGQLKDWLGELGADLRTEAEVVQGTPAWCILGRALSLRASLIVIGTHGFGGFDRLMLGSVAEKVLRNAACPVMTVPPPAETTRAVPFKRLLCAVDFSAPSLEALRYAKAMAQEADARLTILHVVEWPDPDALVTTDVELDLFRRTREEHARQRLASLVSEPERTWCQPVTLLEHGRAWPTIVSVAEKDQSDLIVMGVHGRNVIDLTLFGSTTNHVVRRAPCPVLTLRQ